MTFPLFHRPGTVVFLDDDPDYLEMLAWCCRGTGTCACSCARRGCIELLLQEPPFWEADAWNQQQLINRWREGKPLIPQILGTGRSTRRTLCAHPRVRGRLFDAGDGRPAGAGELDGWPGARVLLTGQADEQVAVRAFNRGLIDQFIPSRRPTSRCA
jgi:hypothetical protein